ncbi:hypothetical protein BJX61DRAFT_549670 [Aspergillus egyptiacus]|nr:hypothetical protein BJX61DRAFT_549670 [Aspergillus egyptiacus]
MGHLVMVNSFSLVPSALFLGGGSAINGMAFDRGSPGDYNLWGDIIGDETWSWEGLLPYFKKSETFTPPSPEQQKEFGISYDLDFHGTSGPVQSSYPPFIYTASKAFINALRQLGIPIQRDGAANAIGGFWNPNSLDPVTRERSYARTTYRELSKSRRNYQLLTETLVTKLTPDLSGVEYITGYNPSLNTTPADAKKRTVRAKKEVIMAAGAVHTPKILQVSGIGSSSLLRSLGVKQIIDLPGVGENLQDHLVQYGSLALTNLSDPTQDSSYLTTNATYDAEMGALYELNRTGPWTVATGNTSLPGQYLRPGLDQSIIHGYEKVKTAILKSMSQDKVALTGNLFGGVACLQKPLSRGSIHAASPDPYNMPLVDFRSLSNPLDLQILIQSIRFNTDILPQTPRIQGPRRSRFAHPSGTCTMLKREDGGCLDSKLRLYGSRGRVRVVDASIFPVVPSTHLQSTVYAVAEKAADIIRGQHS